MADLGLEEAFVRVKATILENPSSMSARRGVEEKLQEILKATQSFRGYSEPEFIKLLQFFILAVGYARKGINDVQILSELSAAVPSGLGVNTLFPVVEEDGRRRPWYYGDMLSDFKIACAVNGESSAYEVLMKFGRYCFFRAGIMPDLLKDSERRSVVDVPYYEWAGSSALRLAATSPFADSSTLEKLASGFSKFRMVLNEAGALAGTSARQTFFDNLLELHGIKGDCGVVKGPQKGQSETEQAIGGIPLFQKRAGYGPGMVNLN